MLSSRTRDVVLAQQTNPFLFCPCWQVSARRVDLSCGCASLCSAARASPSASVLRRVPLAPPPTCRPRRARARPCPPSPINRPRPTTPALARPRVKDGAHARSHVDRPVGRRPGPTLADASPPWLLRLRLDRTAGGRLGPLRGCGGARSLRPVDVPRVRSLHRPGRAAPGLRRRAYAPGARSRGDVLAARQMLPRPEGLPPGQGANRKMHGIVTGVARMTRPPGARPGRLVARGAPDSCVAAARAGARGARRPAAGQAADANPNWRGCGPGRRRAARRGGRGASPQTPGRLSLPAVAGG